MYLGSRLKQAREILKLSQGKLGEPFGFAHSKIRDLESGKQKITMDVAKKIEDIFFISSIWLETGTPPMFTSPTAPVPKPTHTHSGTVPVPVYSALGSCGDGIINHEDQIDCWLHFTEEFARSTFGTVDHGLCCIRATGESMTPAIHPGDTVVLNRNENTFGRDGAIYVLQRGETTLIKRLHQLRGKLRVASDNLEKGTTEDMTAEELAVDGYVIIGRVVYIGKLA